MGTSDRKKPANFFLTVFLVLSIIHCYSCVSRSGDSDNTTPNNGTDVEAPAAANTGSSVQNLSIRNSALVAFRYSGAEIESWLDSPSRAFVEGYFKFPPDLAYDILMGVDVELFEGIDDPIRFEGADWMALVGITRDGIYFAPVGTERSLAGEPSDASVSEASSLGIRLQPDTWYKVRIEADFDTLRFIEYRIEGPGVSTRLDLSQFQLDYPAFIPFDRRSLTYYFFALRSADLVEGAGSTTVYFDDIRGGISGEAGDVVIFENGCEQTASAPELPIALPVSPLNEIVEGRWYKENPDALVSFVSGEGRGGSRACVADATLE